MLARVKASRAFFFSGGKNMMDEPVKNRDEAPTLPTRINLSRKNILMDITAEYLVKYQRF